VPCGMLGDDGQPPGLAADVSWHWQGGYSRPGRWQRCWRFWQWMRAAGGSKLALDEVLFNTKATAHRGGAEATGEDPRCRLPPACRRPPAKAARASPTEGKDVWRGVMTGSLRNYFCITFA
jgi:hypothetical protein